VFASEPVALADSVHVALNVSVPPAAIEFVVVEMLPLPLPLSQLPPLDAEQVQLQPLSVPGNESLTPTPPTVNAAAFVAVIVYVVLLPAFRLVTPSVFVIDRSAAKADTVSTSVTLLLPELGSFVYATVAVFEIEPEALLLTVQVAANVTVPAAPTTTFSLIVPTPNAFGQLPPPDAEQVHVHAASAAGNVSATVTLLTAFALGFVTTMLYVVDEPGAIALTPSDFAIDRSAEGAVQPPLELPGHGSHASPSESPSAFAWS